MRELNRKNIKGEKNIKNASEENEKKTDKEKIKEIAKKRREMQEELDELKGNTAKGKAVCALVFFALIGLLMGAFVGMVKLDVGGVASGALAPVIADVPVLRSILPAELQKKNASELAAEQKQQEAAAAAEAEQAAEEEAAEEEAAAEAEAEAEQAAEEAAAEVDAEAAAEEDAAEAEAAAEEAAAEEAKALQDYVDTYSAMKPKDAAKVFDSMMPDQEDLVVRILENLTSDQRAAILSKMSIANAAIITEKMQQ